MVIIQIKGDEYILLVKDLWFVCHNQNGRGDFKYLVLLMRRCLQGTSSLDIQGNSTADMHLTQFSPLVQQNMQVVFLLFDTNGPIAFYP